MPGKCLLGLPQVYHRRHGSIRRRTFARARGRPENRVFGWPGVRGDGLLSTGKVIAGDVDPLFHARTISH